MSTSFNRIFTGLKQAQPESWPTLLAAFSASYGVGALGFIALPFALGATIDGMGISTTQAGLLGTVEFTFIMLASFAVSPFISRVPRRRSEEHTSELQSLMRTSYDVFCLKKKKIKTKK